MFVAQVNRHKLYVANPKITIKQYESAMADKNWSVIIGDQEIIAGVTHGEALMHKINIEADMSATL